MSLKAEEVYAILKKQIQSGGGTPGPAGVGIQKIEKTGTEGLVDTYTITYTNGQTTTYTVTNGADGEKGEKGDPGEKGEKGERGEKGESGITTQVDHGTSDTTFELPPNQMHTWGEVPSLTLTLGAGTSGIVNEYLFAFTSGATPTTLSLPESIQTDIYVDANTHYECSIVGDYMTFHDWPVEEAAT